MTTIVDISTPNEAPITELYAVLSIDENGEGICAMSMPGGVMMPLVTSSRRVAEKMKLDGDHISKITGKPIKLVRFSRAETLWSNVS